MGIFYLAAALVIIVSLKYLSFVLVYIILSIFITVLLAPIFRFFDEKGLPAILAFIITLAGFVAIFSGVFYIVENSIREFIANMPLYESRFESILKDFNSFLEKYDFKIDFSAFKDTDFVSALKNFIGKAGTVISSFLVVVIGVSFLLFESKDFGKKLDLITKNPDYFKAFFESVQKYFIIKTFTSFLTGFFVGLMLYFLDVPYAFLFGFISFLFNFIPVVGSIIASIPGIVIALITYGFESFFYVSVLYFVINISISNILEPKVMGEGLNLSPAVVFFSLIFWGWLFGMVGMFLAAPLTMTLKLAFRNYEKTKWLSVLLSNYKERG